MDSAVNIASTTRSWPPNKKQTPSAPSSRVFFIFLFLHFFFFRKKSKISYSPKWPSWPLLIWTLCRRGFSVVRAYQIVTSSRVNLWAFPYRYLPACVRTEVVFPDGGFFIFIYEITEDKKKIQLWVVSKVNDEYISRAFYFYLLLFFFFFSLKRSC